MTQIVQKANKHSKLLVSFLILIVVLFYISQNSYYTVQEIPIDVKAISDKKIGITIDTDALHFGSIFKGGSGSRSIVVENLGDVTSKYLLVPKGEVSSWVGLNESEFVLKSGESKEIEVNLYVPKDAIGEYEGTLIIRARRLFLGL
jgi:uncharacterized membrane protein